MLTSILHFSCQSQGENTQVATTSNLKNIKSFIKKNVDFNFTF